jgi:hypothetical protein
MFWTIGFSVPPESILCTEELDSRPSRAPEFEQESRALVALTRALSDSSQTILQTLARARRFNPDAAGEEDRDKAKSTVRTQGLSL